MDFEVYYDSSGRRGHQPATTLAGWAAPKHVWEQFSPLWEKALDDNGVTDRRFSMADLMGSYGRFKGWDDQQKDQLLTALFNVLAKFRPMGMSAYSCTVFFHAYDKAQAQVSKLRKPEAICVNHCVGGLQLTDERPEDESINLHLFFDQNERFLNTVNKVWLQTKKQQRGWPHQVRAIETRTESDYGIQAADLLAWIVNRQRSEAFVRGDPQPIARLSFSNELDRHAYLFVCSWMMDTHYMKVYVDPAQIIEDYGAR
jgi:Protein of unknown function (DUF3800)